MKLSPITLLLTACASVSTAYAALPPVLDSSVAYRAAMLQPATATDTAANQLIARLDKLQVTIANLQATVNQQAVAISGLQQVQSAVNTNVDARLNTLAVKASKPVAPIIISNIPVAAKAAIAVAPAASGSEQQRYQTAYATLRSGSVDLAMIDFQNIIKDYPTGSLADNAQYWLGEAYLLKGKKDDAMQAFDKVVLTYPKSNKVPDALLKLGFVQLSLKNKAKAKEYLDYVILTYPKSNAAKLAIRKAGQAGL
ncbi:MAG: tol-pal system protein YbgF [Methylococcales bacterium]|nr:tol-pal system protein YbgF [Methylococcales bacterium]